MSKDVFTKKETAQAKATPEEKELNKLALERARAAQPGQIAVQKQSLGLSEDLLGGLASGVTESPILNRVLAGISPEVTEGIVQESLADIRPGLQSAGLLDSGVRAELEMSTAADIRRASEEANLNTLFNLLNVSQGQAAQIQQPLLSQSQALGQRLAGLRQQTGTTTLKQMNPFLKSFQTSFGQGLGKGAAGFIGGGSDAFSSALTGMPTG